MTFPIGNQWTDGEEITATKLNTRVDQPLNTLYNSAQASGLGSIGHNQLASPLTGITTATGVATFTGAVTSGRKYIVYGYAEGTQVTTTGNAKIELLVAGVHATFYNFLAAGAGQTVWGGIPFLYLPASTTSIQFQVSISTTAGTFTCNAGAFVELVDVGTA